MPQKDLGVSCSDVMVMDGSSACETILPGIMQRLGS